MEFIEGIFGYKLGQVYVPTPNRVRESGDGELVYTIESEDKKFKDHHICITPITNRISEIFGEIWLSGGGSYLGDNLFVDMRKYLCRYGDISERTRHKRSELYVRKNRREVYFTLGRFSHKTLLVSLHYLDHDLKRVAEEETILENGWAV